MDKVTLNRIEQLLPSLRDEAGIIYKEICEALKGRAICRFAFTLRSFKLQDELYAQGRTKPGKIVTNAKGGQSYHNYGLAIDIVLLVDKNGDGTFETASWQTNVDFDGDGVSDWMEVVKIFKMYGWEWGGDWKFTDMPHFQKTFGKSIKQLQTIAKQPGTDYPVF
jgi:peptidoglycan L-alanyl-D-glutamate endopeptidase CwlK